ncbi:AI-2E family transporter [Amphibacillus jilinensis]|uniref:AI-2E family transporter n=1 Tax=Amphibacillus jilinensis TaxID=1216008 RepID=UPI000372DBDF|nr:AI-2E family transporter [Amphibacillus jilinensis]
MYKKFMKIASVIIVLFIMIYLASLVNWIFYPVLVFGRTLFIPILIASLLFYIFKPLVKWLNNYVSKTMAIIILYICFIAILIGLVSFIVPEIQKQVLLLINSMPAIVDDIQLLLFELQENEWLERLNLVDLFEVEEQVEEVGRSISTTIGDFVSGTINFLGVLFNIMITLFIIPFVLFYMLKEGEKFPESFERLVPEERHEELKRTFKDLDQTLSHYIQGVMLVCLSIGILCYVSFSIVGLDFALILALITMVTNVIPYIGPWIGAVPATIVGLLQSPLMALTVIIIIVVIQQIESLFIQPQVMGKKMSMHPVTVLFLVLVAGRFAGILGMILAVPFYAIAKVLITHLYRVLQLRKTSG